MKIITGLARAHKDCHDTRYELLELWINEIRYTYFEKLPQSEYEKMKEKVKSFKILLMRLRIVKEPFCHSQVSEILMYYFGKEAIELLDQSAETLIGDFLDPYDFYTTNELDDLREYVEEQVSLSSKFILRKILYCVIGYVIKV